MSPSKSRPRESPHLSVDPSGTGWVVFDDPERRVNLLTRPVLERLDRCLSSARAMAGIGEMDVLVVWSGKADTFMAGADVHDIEGVEDPGEGEEACRLVQGIFQKLADLPIPTLSAIHGVCVGGGLEMALATSRILVSDAEETRLGFPEILLGILPAWGGTTRLPKRIGLRKATEMILSGRKVKASRAYDLGLADGILPAGGFRKHVLTAARELARNPGPPSRTPGLGRMVLEGTSLGRGIILSRARKAVVERAGTHYPAPFRALEILERTEDLTVPASLEAEARAAGFLVTTPVSKNLVHLYHLREDARKGRGIPQECLSLPRRPSASPTTGNPAEEAVGRVLAPFLEEGRALVAEGVPVEAVDREARRFGMAFGPHGLLRGKKPRRAPAGEGSQEIQSRLILPMIPAACRILEDGVVKRAGAVDLSLVVGGGFPAFRGGPLRYADSLGIQFLLESLDKLAQRLGPRFFPPTLLREMSREGSSFYHRFP